MTSWVDWNWYTARSDWETFKAVGAIVLTLFYIAGNTVLGLWQRGRKQKRGTDGRP